jgi:hypothetical protein
MRMGISRQEWCESAGELPPSCAWDPFSECRTIRPEMAEHLGMLCVLLPSDVVH